MSKGDGGLDQRDAPDGGMLHLLQKSPCLQLRILERLRHIVDAARRNARSGQQREPLVSRPCAKDLAQSLGEGFPHAHTIRVVGVGRVTIPVILLTNRIQHIAKSIPQGIVSDGEGEVAIAGSKRLIGSNGWMGASQRSRHLPCHEVGLGMVRLPGDDRFQQRHIDIIPEARLLTRS